MIRRKLSDDYKERENFLESYCRTTSEPVKEEENKKSVDMKRKGKLLAALKAIDSTDD